MLSFFSSFQLYNRNHNSLHALEEAEEEVTNGYDFGSILIFFLSALTKVRNEGRRLGHRIKMFMVHTSNSIERLKKNLFTKKNLWKIDAN